LSHKEKKALKKQKKMNEEMEKITKKGGQVNHAYIARLKSSSNDNLMNFFRVIVSWIKTLLFLKP